FMEDYTYHFEPGNQMNLGAHMLEVCPTIASAKPRIEVHTLGIGGKSDPARLVFDCAAGPAICASLVDLGNRFRLIITLVDAVEATHDMPKLPVARVLMKPQPSLATAAEAWIHAGGAHHTVYSQNVTVEQLTDWADMCGIECIVIDNDTKINSLLKELRWNEIVYKLM
ncbi:MAG: L-arabinose isomerase, partial [Clostridiaceae bacterium]|nr:L-arabinose isomerase [Clostridiaceae bacterium]